MENSGWVSQGTFPKNLSNGTDWGFKMVRGADTFWLNVDSAESLMTLANSGIRASTMGTSMRKMLQELIAPQGSEVQKFDSTETINKFKAKFPWINHGCLSLHKMKAMLDGKLIPVKISGTKKFEIWTKEDIEAGKLDKINAEIRAANREVRRNDTANRKYFEKVLREKGVKGIVDLIIGELK